MRMGTLRGILAGPLCLVANIGFSQSEPVDKNVGGAYLGGIASFGQGTTAGDSSPGPAWLLGLDLGYVIKRDTWNRIELGLELDRGGVSFEDKKLARDVDLDLDFGALVKAGYGYSLGDHAFGVFRVGVGIAQASYQGKFGSLSIDGGKDTGFMSMIGWDAVMPVDEKVELNFGVNLRNIAFKFNESAGSSFQLNMPVLSVGARVRL